MHEAPWGSAHTCRLPVLPRPEAQLSATQERPFRGLILFPYSQGLVAPARGQP